MRTMAISISTLVLLVALVPAAASAQEKSLAARDSDECWDLPGISGNGTITYSFVEGPYYSSSARWDGLTYEQAKQAVRDAANRWNIFLSIPDFEEVSSGGVLSIVMGAGAAVGTERDGGKTTKVNLPRGPYYTVNGNNSNAFFKVVFHELLHVFCLEHGDYDGSICPSGNTQDRLGAFWDYGVPGMGELRSLRRNCGTDRTRLATLYFYPLLVQTACNDSGPETSLTLTANLRLNGVLVPSAQIEDYRWETRPDTSSSWDQKTLAWNNGSRNLSLTACTGCPGAPVPRYWVRAKIRYYGRVDELVTEPRWVDLSSCPYSQ